MQATSTLLLPARLSATLAGCTGDDDGDGGSGTTLEIAGTPLAGTVGGEPWSFVVGGTDAFLSRDKPDFFSDLYGESVTLCGFASGAGNHLIVAIPKAVGEYPFTTQQNMTFVVGGTDNLVTFKGKVRVDSVSATALTGGLVGRYNSENEVSGTFRSRSAPTCRRRSQLVASCTRKPRSFHLSNVSSAVTSVSPRSMAVATSIRSAGSACEWASSAAAIPSSPSRVSS
jgi:hypothetical protein